MFKLAVMVSGQVGVRTLEHICKNYPNDLCAIVAETEDDLKAIGKAIDIPSPAAKYRWRDGIEEDSSPLRELDREQKMLRAPRITGAVIILRRRGPQGRNPLR